MNRENKIIWQHWAKVSLVVWATVALAIVGVGCTRAKSKGLPTAPPGATVTISSVDVSASPTVISTAEETPTTGIQPPPPTTPLEATPTSPPVPTDTPPPAGPGKHVIQPGDTLYSIAQRYNMTVDELKALNKITEGDSLQVGQVLDVSPGTVTTAPTPTTKPSGETTKPTGEVVHVVARGENLFRIALRYGTTVKAIADRNNIVNPALIRVGQKLYISGGGAPAPSDKTHVVKRGENLFRIALRYGTTVQAIMQANRLSNTIIYVGQRLQIP